MISRAEQLKRRATCKRYLEKAGNLPGAMQLAKRDHFSVNTSVWIGALSEVLSEQAQREAEEKIKQGRKTLKAIETRQHARRGSKTRSARKGRRTTAHAR